MAKEALMIESKAIADIIDYLDGVAFSKAVDAIGDSHKTILSGCGSSGIAAKKFAHSLCCIEQNAQFLSPAEAVHGGLGCVKKGDAVILISRGGKTAELLPMAEVCRVKEAVLIVITENPDSPLGNMAQIVIQPKVEKECDKYNVMATASFIVIVAIMDALLVAIMEKTGYRLEQFSLIHPGGAVGDRLNSH